MKSLQEEIDDILEKDGLTLEGDDVDSINTLMKECTSDLDNLLEENTPQRLLWESQKRAMQCKDLRGVRWHPAIIRWCVALHDKSPAAYKALRDSKFIILPHQNTINQFVHYTDLRAGFDAKFVERLVDDFDLYKQPPHAKHVCRMWDEMKLKSGLAYNPHSGKITGLTSIGSFNEEIRDFERRCKNINEPPLATHVLVLMVRGITPKLQKPVAYFPCQGGCTSNELYSIVSEAVELLEFVGFHVDSYTSDGASSNRKFYSMQKVLEDSTIDGITFATPHSIRTGERIFFMSDVLHLIKTSRNCWENPRPDGTRNMVLSTSFYHRNNFLM